MVTGHENSDDDDDDDDDCVSSIELFEDRLAGHSFGVDVDVDVNGNGYLYECFKWSSNDSRSDANSEDIRIDFV